MKKIFSSIALLFFPFLAMADDFKILYLNTPTITINGKSKKVGDTFHDSDKITWKDSKQAMKVEVVGKKQIKLFTAMQMKNYTNVKSYYLKANQFSTRGDDEEANECEYTLEDLFSIDFESIYLLDYVVIDMGMSIENEEDGYLVKFTDKNGDNATVKLFDEEGHITIRREIFDNLEGTFPITICYMADGKEMGNTTVNMTLVPLEIKKHK